MRAGRLRHRVILLKPTDQLDEYNERAVDGFFEAAQFWAEIVDLSGTEPLEADKLSPSVSTQIVARYRDDVSPQDRLQHGGDIYDIVSITDPTGRRIMIRIEARRRD